MGRWHRQQFSSLHALPWMLLAVVLGRFLLFVVLIPPMAMSPIEAGMLPLTIAHVRGVAVGIAVGIAAGITGGIAVGIGVGITAGITGGIAVGITGGIAVGIILGIAGGIAVGIAAGITVGLTFGIVMGIPLRIAIGIAFGIAFGIVIWIVGGIADGIAAGIAASIASSRAYYLPLHSLIVWPRVRAAFYRCHPVAWDDLCGVPFAVSHACWRRTRRLIARPASRRSIG